MPRKSPARKLKLGHEIAKDIIAHRQSSLVQREKVLRTYRTSRMRQTQASGKQIESFAAVESKGCLIAVGDSWFDYLGEPFRRDDILERLEGAGYDIESTARAGAAVEAIAYGGNAQLVDLAKCLDKVQRRGVVPKAILLSGGGNDIAGNEFGMLLNDAKSPIAGWNDEVVDGVINQRIATAYRTVLDAITQFCHYYFKQELTILIHGYDYAVPDGRGYLGGLGCLPGPWLQPGFFEKHFKDLSKATAMVQDLIDRFNTMLQKLEQEPTYKDHVRYVNLRRTLSNVLPGRAYRTWWANELHPEPKGFDAVTAKFLSALEER